MRYPFLDALRGFSLCSMTLYHLLWDIVYLSGRSLPWYDGMAGYLWQQSICWTFIAVSGMSLALEVKKKGRKRAAKSRLVLVGWGTAITFVTRQAMPQEPIYFGVIFFLGAVSLLAICFWPVMEKKPKGAALFCGTLFFFLRNAPRGFWGFERMVGPALPEMLTHFGLFSAFWGFPPRDFYSADYFPLIPWWGLFGFAAALGALWLKKGSVPDLLKKDVPFLRTLGRKSLWIYLLHQPVIMGVMWGMGMIKI